MMFDEIYCKIKLPEDAPDFVKRIPCFQTYDLGKGMGQYTITEDGELQLDSTTLTFMLAEAMGAPEGFQPKPMKISYKRKRIEMYTSNIRGGAPSKDGYVYYTDDGSDYIEITYIVQIRNSKVSSIKEKIRTAKPAQKYFSR